LTQPKLRTAEAGLYQPIPCRNTLAVGTALDANNPAIAKLNNGEAYYGDATIFGKAYDAGYEPIKDASGVVGAYFVGYSK
jgi:hypothetical protein